MSATQDRSVIEHADREHRLALNRQVAARSRKRKQTEVEQLHVRIDALELANSALSGRLCLRETETTRLNGINAARLAGDQVVVSVPDSVEMPKTLAGHQASGSFRAYIAKDSTPDMPNNCQAEALPICTLPTPIAKLDLRPEVPDLFSGIAMAEAAPLSNSIANIPAHPLPAERFSRENPMDYRFQRNLAKHDSGTKVNTPPHAMVSCQSVPAFLLPQRGPAMAEQQLCHQQQHTSVGTKQHRRVRVIHSPPRHHTAPPTFTSGSHHAPGSIRRSTAGMPSLHTARSALNGNCFASKLQATAHCFVTSPSAEAQVFEHQVPKTPQLWHSVQAQPASGDASHSYDSVTISAQHRQAWDASHGSLQSFKKMCRHLQSNHQQSWSIASASDHSSKLPTIMHQNDASTPSLSIPEYAWPDVRQLRKTSSVPEAQQPFHCSSSMLPLPAKYPPVSPLHLWPPYSIQCQQPLPWASPKTLQSPQCSSLIIPQQPLQPAFQLDPSAPRIPQQSSPAATTRLPSQTPKAAAVTRFGQAQRPQCVMTCSGSLPMSAAEVEAVHASQLEELQHSTLDWMAANFLHSGTA
ncbi:TPA: hypothetical protein ACH3X1_006223 [Trebouxia sp. C0004]